MILTGQWKNRSLIWALMLFCFLFSLSSVEAKETTSTSDDITANSLLLAVEVDSYTISDSLSAYQTDGKLFVPICQLANQLTILLMCEMNKQYASGFILSQDRAFELSFKEKTALINKHPLPFDEKLIRLEQDDFYVEVSLIEKWLPIKLEVDLSRLVLQVHPLEPLPLQLRIERERAASALQHSDDTRPYLYPRTPLPYQLISAPFIDQTFSLNILNSNGVRQISDTSTTFIAADFLKAEGALFYSNGKQAGIPADLRFTLSRNDPDGELLGPLRSRSISIGNITMPGLTNIARSSSTGRGLFLSNVPFTRPAQFDKYTFEGDLMPGWDVELYFNDALVGYQQSQANGKYLFADQPLIFGTNNFRLVFHGPQGQTQVKTSTFLLNQSLARPGELLYTVATQGNQKDTMRALTQFEFGINKKLSISGGVAVLPPLTIPNEMQPLYYNNLGLRTYFDSFVLGFNYAHSKDNSAMQSVSLNTEIASIALGANYARLINGFVSELFLPQSDPIQTSSSLRADGNIPINKKKLLPITVQLQRDQLLSGNHNTYLTAQITGVAYATTLTNSLTANQVFGQKNVVNSLQLSRNVSGGSIRSQINYNLAPDKGLATIVVTADYPLREGYLANFNATRTFTGTPQNNYSLTLNKNLGAYALRLSLGYNQPGGTSLGMQFFTSIGKDTRAQHWLFDAIPLAGTGMVSIRVFVDKNLNGQMDGSDEPVRGVSFILNGSTLSAKTDENGLLWIGHLPVQIPINLTLNTASLEDPQWAPTIPGVSFVARPGYVATFDFPLIMSSDVEGAVYLVDKNKKRGIGDVEIELLNAQEQVLAHTTTASDGYYLFSNQTPGSYLVRISPKQTLKLGLKNSPVQKITIQSEGALIKIPGFILSPKK